MNSTVFCYNTFMEPFTIFVSALILSLATFVVTSAAKSNITLDSFREFPAISFSSLKVPTKTPTVIPSPTPSPTPTPFPLPKAKTIPNDSHVFQTFNNCGPAALSMTLSYYGIIKTQEELGTALRPYQVTNGNNDDKSVTLDELANKAKEYNLIPFHRPNGTIELMKQFIARGYPVITRTLLEEHNDIGHYRVIKGYDDEIQELIQDDSLQGKNLQYPYTTFIELWKKFQYEYLILVPPEKENDIKNILGKDADLTDSWTTAVKEAEKEIEKNPNDTYAHFNLSVSLYHTGDYKRAKEEFEKVEHLLPFRMLWYQIEPIQTYFELGEYQKVMDMTEYIFNNQNRAFSELYLIRGDIYKKQGNRENAKKEYQNAVYYNKNLKSAQEAMQSMQ